MKIHKTYHSYETIFFENQFIKMFYEMKIDTFIKLIEGLTGREFNL